MLVPHTVRGQEDSLPTQPDTTLKARGAPLGALGAAWRTLSDSSRAGWVRPISSMLVPGLGQFMGKRERGAIYLAADVFLIARYVTFRREGTREKKRFRALAFEVARGEFAPSLRDTVFEYFEQMGRFVESGPFDTDPGAGIIPPNDPETFNGSIWALARETFFENPDSAPAVDSPEYQRAIAFYRSRAIGPNFRWSWRNARIEQDVYRQTIKKSDDGFRRASQQLGLILANHLLSAVDAFITHRLSRVRKGTELSSMIWTSSPNSFEPEARLSLRFSFR